jgi:hypothetical protein
MNLLAPMNERFEATGELDPSVFQDWLWGTNPEDPCHIDVLFNRNQLLGLLVCRYKAQHILSHGSSQQQPDSMDRMVIMDKPIAEMTWRELKDTMANVLLEWPTYLDRIRKRIRFHQMVRNVHRFVDACAARFGYLAQSALDETVLDDLADTQPCREPQVGDKMELTPAAKKRMLCGLLVLYRHLHLLAVAKQAPTLDSALVVSKYNYEASMEQFHLLCMHISLPVAARLTYRHDFPGMYNHVSQVVFFHNSEYSRVPRHPYADIHRAPPIHVLPAIMELYPQIQLRFEEDNINPSKSSQWYWLLIAGRIYLVTPTSMVIYSDQVQDLLSYYLVHINEKN